MGDLVVKKESEDSLITKPVDQYLSNMSEEKVKRIARLQAMEMLSILRDKIANIPQTPEGYVKANDLYEVFAIADNEARSGG